MHYNQWVQYEDTDEGPIIVDVLYDWELDRAKAAFAGTDGKNEKSANAPGVFAEIGALPAGTLITEEGLAHLFGKCTASIKNAVDRGELPRPARLMGKPTWTAGAIVAHHQERLAAEAKMFAKLRG
jgi:hypothetical protein